QTICFLEPASRWLFCLRLRCAFCDNKIFLALIRNSSLRATGSSGCTSNGSKGSRMYLVSSSKNRVLAGLTMLLSASVAAYAGAKPPRPQEKPAIPANELVRQAVQTEVGSQRRNQRMMYHMRKEAPERVETKEYDDTGEGTVARLLSINDQPLPRQIQANEEH